MPQSRLFLAISLGLTLTLYAVMALWAVPRLTEGAGGQLPFDLRIAGYSGDEARSYLAALTPSARAFYGDVVGRLDTLFPPLLALSLCLSYQALASRRVSMILSALAILAAVLDLMENAAIASMLRADLATIRDDAIALASRLTQLKWGADLVTLAALVGLLGLRRLGVRR